LGSLNAHDKKGTQEQASFKKAKKNKQLWIIQ